MDGGGWHQADAGMAMVVIMLKERRDDVADVIDAGAAGRKRGGVLGGFEKALAVRVMVALARPGKAGFDTQIDEQLGQRLGTHRCATASR